jgi:hypothetical protein
MRRRLPFWEMFDTIRRSAEFNLYDQRLLEYVDDFGKHWHDTTRFGHRYEPRPHQGLYIYTFSNIHEMRVQEERDFAYIEQELLALRTSMQNLLAYVRQNYVELDLKAMSERAGNNYQQGLAEFRGRIEPKD